LNKRYDAVRRILVFYGGSDPTNETEKALEAIRLLGAPEIAVDVVIGAANPHAAEVKAILADMPQAALHCQIQTMAMLMSNADLALGAGGTTTWERCFLGLPSLITVVADNQTASAMAVALAGMARLLGKSDLVNCTQMAEALSQVISQPFELEAISRRCLDLFNQRDGSVHGDIIASLWECSHAA
jgi:UDP-2,4-diacetamido-2,4,6-trideoxy-beta-L-altropyranose hydrolase